MEKGMTGGLAEWWGVRCGRAVRAAMPRTGAKQAAGGRLGPWRADVDAGECGMCLLWCGVLAVWLVHQLRASQMPVGTGVRRAMRGRCRCRCQPTIRHAAIGTGEWHNAHARLLVPTQEGDACLGERGGDCMRAAALHHAHHARLVLRRMYGQGL